MQIHSDSHGEVLYISSISTASGNFYFVSHTRGSLIMAFHYTCKESKILNVLLQAGVWWLHSYTSFYMHFSWRPHLADDLFTVGMHFQSFDCTMAGPKAAPLKQIWALSALIKGIVQSGEEANSHGLSAILAQGKAHLVCSISPYRCIELYIFPLFWWLTLIFFALK